LKKLGELNFDIENALDILQCLLFLDEVLWLDRIKNWLR